MSLDAGCLPDDFGGGIMISQCWYIMSGRVVGLYSKDSVVM